MLCENKWPRSQRGINDVLLYLMFHTVAINNLGFKIIRGWKLTIDNSVMIRLWNARRKLYEGLSSCLESSGNTRRLAHKLSLPLKFSPSFAFQSSWILIFLSSHWTPSEFLTFELKNKPVHPKISMHILYTVFYTFSKVLTRRFCLKIKRSCTCWSFPLSSWP